jgi:hypothetical protein
MADLGPLEVAVNGQQINEAVLHFLAGHSVTGIIEPFRIYWTAYFVPQENDGALSAELLSTAHHLLHERAAAIEDEQLREAYLQKIPAHREIVSEFRNADATLNSSDPMQLSELQFAKR